MTKILSNILRISIAVMAWFAVACTAESPDGPSVSRPVEFSIPSRADITDVTDFRIILYSAEDHLSMLHYWKETGTYRYTPGMNRLEPWDGINVNDESGIKGAIGSRFVTFISPALPCNDDGRINLQYNNDNNGFDKFLVSKPEYEFVGGPGIIQTGAEVVDHRAKINIDFYKTNSNIVDFEIKDFKIVGMANPVYSPISNQVIAGNMDVELDDPTLDDSNIETVVDGSIIGYKHRKGGVYYVPAGIYAPLDEAYKIICQEEHFKEWNRFIYSDNKSISPNGDYLYISFTIHRKMNGDVDVSDKIILPVTTKDRTLEPMHTYNLYVTINSEYVDVMLNVFDVSGDKVNDWEQGNNDQEQEIS